MTCPVRDRAWVLPYYLDHIYKLNYPKKLISVLWVLNQSTDESEEMLKKFKHNYEHEYNKITIDRYHGSRKVPKDLRNNQIRLNHTYSHLAEMRNYILSKVGNHDYVFSCDSDILIRSDSLSRLVNHGKDIISSVIYNGYKYDRENPWKYPNVLKILSNGRVEHIANSYIKNAQEATESKLLKCDITGAVYLISNKVAEQIQYGYNIQGEDVEFCLRAKEKGFEIWTDVGIFNQHIMDEEMLDEYLQKLTKT